MLIAKDDDLNTIHTFHGRADRRILRSAQTKFKRAVLLHMQQSTTIGRHACARPNTTPENAAVHSATLTRTHDQTRWSQRRGTRPLGCAGVAWGWSFPGSALSAADPTRHLDWSRTPVTDGWAARTTRCPPRPAPATSCRCRPGVESQHGGCGRLSSARWPADTGAHTRVRKGIVRVTIARPATTRYSPRHSDAWAWTQMRQLTAHSWPMHPSPCHRHRTPRRTCRRCSPS